MSDRLGVSVTPTSLTVGAGDTAQATATIRNAGTSVDQFTIAVDGLDASWYALPVSSVALFPNDKDELKITLHPPKEGIKGGTYPFRIKVTSQENAADFATVNMVLQVGTLPEVGVDIAPLSVTGRRGHYHVMITNPGASDAVLNLRASSADRRVRLAVGPPGAVPVPPGGRIDASVDAGLGWLTLFFGKREVPFQVTATAAGSTEGKTAAAKLVAITWYQWLGQIRWPWLSRPPVINTFRATTDDNRQFRLAWAVKRAAEVKLDDEAIAKTGDRTVRPTEARTYVLTASNRYGTATQKVEVRPVTMPKAVTSDRIKVSLSSTQLQANAGGMPVPVAVKVENMGQIVDKFLVEVQGIDESWYTRSASSIALMPQASSQVQVALQPPKRKPVREGTYPFAITVRSQAQPQDATTILAQLRIPPLIEYKATVRPFRVTGRGKGSFTVTLANTGVSDVALSLDATDLDDGLTFRFKKETPVIPAWSSLDVTMVAKQKRGMPLGDKKRFDITVNAREPEGKCQTAACELHVAPVSSWKIVWRIVRALIVLGIIFVVVFFVLKWGGGLGQLVKSPKTWVNQFTQTVEGWFNR